MENIRIIARMDIKGSKLIKGIQLEGLRVIGDPNEYAQKYYEVGIDEIIFIDVVASLYGRNSLEDIVRKTASSIFIPMTVGGGLRSVSDVRRMLKNGADKVAVNTQAVKRPTLISEISEAFGSQCMVLSIEAKKRKGGGWEALIDNGREHTGLDAIEWARKGVELGAGEILLTSVDKDGTMKGPDVELIRSISPKVGVPVIASGGISSGDHLKKAVCIAKADAVAIGAALHFQKMTYGQFISKAREYGINVKKGINLIHT